MDEDSKENEGESDESDAESNHSKDEISKEDEIDQLEMLKRIQVYLKPGETILKAIKRLGNLSKSNSSGASSSSSSVGLSASQRWLKKKNPPAQAGQSSTASNYTTEDIQGFKESLEKLTGYANYFIDRGFYDIYEETPEKIQRKIEKSQANAEDKSGNDKKLFDIFADDIDEKEPEKPKTSEKAEVLQGDSFCPYIFIYLLSVLINTFFCFILIKTR